ncbi:acyl carrier protein [Amycolatopsis sp. cg9]|uniref:acyl carrier protein n=1 Tax=Amycolatopsis sp. cg9 TaxID=3238801 RepID=UPI003525B0B7
MPELTLEDHSRIKKIVCGVLEVDPDALTDTDGFEDHGIDSVKAIEIITILEDELDITIDLAELERITNLERVYEIVATAR